MNSGALSSYVQRVLILWGIFVFAIFIYTDFAMPSTVVISDYLMTFFTAGWIADHGQWQILYPQPGASTFHGEPFDLKAHQLLSLLPDHSVAEYMYMPLSAWVFAPLSRLAPNFSLFAFQVISLALMFASSLLVLGKNRQALSAAVALLVFLPVFLTLWIGQVGILFGLLPISLGFYLLHKDRDFLAGLSFSLLFLKPQMLIPAGFLMAGRVFEKKIYSLLGFACGTGALFALNYTLFGRSLCLSWLDCLKLSDRIYSDPAMGVPVRLATSLPRAILLSLPVTVHGTYKPLLYAMAAILAIAGLLVLWKLKSSGLKSTGKLRCALVLGSLALPCVVPHLFIYDLCVLSPIWLVVLGSDMLDPDNLPLRRVRLACLVLFAAINLYCLVLVALTALCQPLLLVAVMLIVYLVSLTRFWHARIA